MERDPTSSFSSRVSLDPRLPAILLKSHHDEYMREITPLLAEQQVHLQKAMDLQKQIQEKLEAFASMQSPHLPKRLRNSCDVHIMPIKTHSKASISPLAHSPTFTQKHVGTVEKKSRFARWFSPQPNQ